ncbi:MAG: hypothetical protein M0030_04580 [Actinomycetota bacterium]|nr:hypothetical protein [Actinomycetota bacterium]
MADREFSEKRREQLARKGDALPDGSYPIPDCDALRRAVYSYGRAPVAHRPALRALIIRRKNELGCTEPALEKLDHEDSKVKIHKKGKTTVAIRKA